MPDIAPARQAQRTPRPPTIVALAVLLGLLTVAALQGGLAMVIDPLEPLGMSVEFLKGAPVDTYLLPGLFLLGIAGASLITLPGLLLSWTWKWAAPIEARIGYRWPWIASVAIGIGLLTFEIIQLFTVPFHPLMHPLLIVWSVAILGLAFADSARKHLRVELSGDDPNRDSDYSRTSYDMKPDRPG